VISLALHTFSSETQLLASVAVHVTVVSPIGNNEPDTGMQVGVIGPSTSSTAVAVNVTVAPEGLVASTVLSSGTVTMGGVVSCWIILNTYAEPELQLVLTVGRHASSLAYAPTIAVSPEIETESPKKSRVSASEAVNF